MTTRMLVACVKWKVRPLSLLVLVVVSTWLISTPQLMAQVEPTQRFNTFVKQQAAMLRAHDQPPRSAAEWATAREQLRNNLEKAWGRFPETPCPLEPRKLGVLDRDGYRIEKIVFQTLPDVWMTANAYVPTVSSGARLPAVLCVHGHWAGAKQDPVVQARCIGLAKLGFVVLCVDAFGAGERGVETKLGEYHGELTGAMLLLLGRPLSGIQVYENMRAVDYLQSRPEVDPDRIGITGASGGGNQSMYAGTYDERFRCVVPTCSVGNYQAYLSAACCMCEVVPGILRFSEEGNVLGLAAQRGLMVTSATQDAFQFSVDQARISVGRAKEIAALTGPSDSGRVKHTIIESPHHYNQPMREAMYGWMTRHLKGTGDGSPLLEPEITPEEPETLRCFPGDSRPESWVTIPKFVAAEARKLLDARRAGPDQSTLAAITQQSGDAQRAIRAPALEALTEALGGQPDSSPLHLQVTSDSRPGYSLLAFETEPGLEIEAHIDSTEPETVSTSKIAILLDVDHGAAHAFESERAQQLRADGWKIVAPELRATGRFAYPSDKVGNAVDHNSAEWSLWLGRPLLGQWAWDIRRTLDALNLHLRSLPPNIAVVGLGSSGVIAVTSGAMDERFSDVISSEGLASYIVDRPVRGQRLGVLVPGLLRDIGDVDHIAALIAPRKLTIEGGVNGGGNVMQEDALKAAFDYCTQMYRALGASGNLSVRPALHD